MTLPEPLEPAPAPRLPRRPGRQVTYLLIVGSAATLALVGAGLPLVFGHDAAGSGSASGGVSALQAGAPPADPGQATAGALPPAATPRAGETQSAGATPTSASGTAAGTGAALPPRAPGSTAPGSAGAAASSAAGRGGSAATTSGPRATGAATPKGAAPRRTGSAPRPGPTGRAGPTAPARAPAGGAQRTASAVGITPTQVTLGALLTDFGTANSAGASVTGYSPAQQQEYFDAFASDTNAHGGIDGRTLVMRYETSDITDPNSQKAACDTITDTDQSFAVTNVLGIYGPPILCLTKTHGVPYLSNDGAVSDYYTQSNGLLFTLQPSTLRTQANAVYEDHLAGELTSGDKVGFLREDQYLQADEKSVEDYLRGFGVTVTDGVMSSSSIQDAPAQAAVAAQQFCSAGVTKVFLAVNSLYAQDFISSLPPGCAPAYYSSDFDYQMDGDTFVSGMPASYFNHAVGVSSSDVGNTTLTPSEQSCLTAYNTYETAHGKVALASTDKAVLRAVAACGLVRTFVAGVHAAGVNPTRASFASSLAGIGGFDDPGYESATFHPGKTDAPDAVRTVRADATCKCWQTIGSGAFHPAHFR